MNPPEMALFVLDTNILVAALSSRSSAHWVINALMSEDFAICVSSEILLEYEEILSIKYGKMVASDFLKALEELPNVINVTVYYHWGLLKDPDDNKFVDAAIAGSASYIVSEDRDFRTLLNTSFPPVKLLRLEQFFSWYMENKSV
jgi:putative PIN family toxin of toxin-antitoxin system